MTDGTERRLLIMNMTGLVTGLKHGLVTPEMLKDALFAFFHRTHVLSEVKARLLEALSAPVATAATAAYVDGIVEIVRQADLQKRVMLYSIRSTIPDLNYLLKANGYGGIEPQTTGEDAAIARAICAANPTLLPLWDPYKMGRETIKEFYSRRGMNEPIVVTIQHTQVNQPGYYPIRYNEGEGPEAFARRVFGENVVCIHLNERLLVRSQEPPLNDRDAVVITLYHYGPDYSLDDSLDVSRGRLVWVKTESLSLIEAVHIAEPGPMTPFIRQLRLTSKSMKALLIDGVVYPPENYFGLWLRPGQKVTIVI